MVWLLSKDRRSLDILSVKKEAKLSASEIPGVEEGKGEGDLRCRSLTVCQSRLWLPRDDVGIVAFLGCEDRLWYLLRKDLKVDSRVGMFPEVFGMADGRSESTEGRSKPGLDGD